MLPFLLSLAAGWFLARTLTAQAFAGPRWAAVAAEAGLSALFGPGFASLGFFVLTLANAANLSTVLAMSTLLAASCAAVWWKYAEPAPAEQTLSRSFPWPWVLVAAALAGLGVFLLDFQTATAANPNGEWDATAIWNLRARCLAGGAETWKRAISAEIGGHMTGAAHPGYPLFLSLFLAMQWVVSGNASGNFDVAVPITASLLFALALWMLLGASLAHRATVTMGAVGWLLLLASEVFVSQAASQYSDLLLGLAFLSALVLMDAAARAARASRLLLAAGLAIGFAPWIKNEGLPFAVAAFACIAWRFPGSGMLWAGLGAAPGLLATLVLKLIAEGRESMFPATAGEALAKMADPSRWWQILLGFGKAVYEAGAPWAHPVLLLAVLALVLRFRPAAERRSITWLWIPLAAAFAAEYGLYVVTAADLTWHISTSVSRLLAQLWPALLWMILLLLRTPDEHFPESGAVSGTKRVSRPKNRQ